MTLIKGHWEEVVFEWWVGVGRRESWFGNLTKKQASPPGNRSSFSGQNYAAEIDGGYGLVA
tara:strand:+ start:417 stop:599 length:183 start_codon:yes stop_codon:yes gene_type:complete